MNPYIVYARIRVIVLANKLGLINIPHIDDDVLITTCKGE